MQHKKRYAQVGVGSRGWCYAKALAKDLSTECELVGLCDKNKGRLELYNHRIKNELKGRPVPLYSDTQFDRMIREKKPDAVVVTSKDSTHHKYVVRAL